MTTTIRIFLCFLFTAPVFLVKASDSLSIHFNKTHWLQGDTISFDCAVPAWVAKKKTGTLTLLIEDVHHLGLWKLRYPVLQGYASADIILPDSLPGDIYAFHFKLQASFFEMRGKVKSRYNQNTIRNVVLLQNKQLVSQDIPLDSDKQFSIGKLLFEKQAVVFFSPINNKKNNDLDIEVVTKLDSTAKSMGDTTLFLNIGKPLASSSMDASKMDYTFFNDDTSGTLRNVVITGKRKTAADKFEDEYVSGLFKGSDGYVFDGLESNQFSGAISILQWLVGRVGGLSIARNNEGGSDILWRGATTDLFLDEMPADDILLESISPADVAMIKVFRPPFFGSFGGGGGGAIAIYTRRGINGESSSGPRHRFVVNGYTPAIYTLPVNSRQPDSN